MLFKYVKHLLSPAEAGGGGGAALAEPDHADSPPNSLDQFMESVYEMAGTPNPNKPNNGDPPSKPAGDNVPAGTAPAAAPAAAAAPAVKEPPKPAAAKVDPAVADKAAAKADDSKGADDDEPWPRDANGWKKFKLARKEERTKYEGQIKERETQLQTLQGRVKELETKATVTPEGQTPETKEQVDRLNKQLEEMSDRIRIADVTQHPKFQKYFGDQVSEQISLAKSILGDEKGVEFEKLVSIPEHPAIREWKKDKMEEFIAQLSPFEAQRLGGIQNDLDRIERSKQKEIDRNKEHVATLHNQSMERQNAAKANREKLFTDVISNLSDDKVGVAVFQKKPGDDAWNQGVDKRVSDAKRILFGGQDVKTEEVYRAALNAAAYPFILESYGQDRKEWEEKITKLEAQILELTAAQPGTRGTSGAEATPGQETPRSRVADTSMNPQDAVAAWMKSTVGES